MLCLADRFFPSYQLWQAAAKSGADLLWRTRHKARLDVHRRLPDGSYLSPYLRLHPDRRNQRKAIVVRAIDYRLKDVPDAEPVYRPITTILDHKQAPARELAALYHEADSRDAQRLLSRLLCGELVLSYVPEAEQRRWRTLGAHQAAVGAR
jgi:hypothetical protein